MTLTLAIHIFCLTISIILTITLALFAAFGNRSSAWLTRFNIYLTTCGVGTGIMLLYSKPLGSHCAMLISYVLVFSIVTAFIRRKNMRLSQAIRYNS